jgi:hypothetical protein
MGDVQLAHHTSFNMLTCLTHCICDSCWHQCLPRCLIILFLQEAGAEVPRCWCSWCASRWKSKQPCNCGQKILWVGTFLTGEVVMNCLIQQCIGGKQSIDFVLCFSFSGQPYGGTFMVLRTIKKRFQVRKGTLRTGHRQVTGIKNLVLSYVHPWVLRAVSGSWDRQAICNQLSST